MQNFTGGKILEAIEQKRLKPEDVTVHMRRLAVEYLMLNTDWNRTQIAAVFQVHPDSISRDMRHLQEVTSKLETPDVGETMRMAKRLVFKANMLAQKAAAKGNYELVWKIENDLIDKLGRMGIINYSSEMIKVHTGDVIESGARKTTVKVDGDVHNNYGFSETEQQQIDEIFARVHSRKNATQPGALVVATQDDQGTAV